MYRVVVDTNLIVSGTATTNTIPYYLLEAWRQGKYILVTSPQIIAEVKEVLMRPSVQKLIPLSSSEIDKVIETLETKAFITSGNLIVDVIKTDPDDNIIIACAIEGSATHIVTGDKKSLLPIKEYQGIQIITAREFLERHLNKNLPVGFKT